ncbi:interferon-inducible GTPase 5-like [Protopterus annectens]|uniref:interferon-inducible GTPase 5-like n=1 Tax=Protopterus annectens TaxID=7888 RepID=UPI001CFA6840|nr:interferon-inducible GTPase 5-like [Protopterus annectens]XP_043936496.1 interferon-inducible GTPase 5-like [Protopterus annectens]XP_043936497.1 interferon-inducible GTPase 5-like [Protopterus annectens]XP_043936498.1 interferon-inducible GTPase 5-like [Protopterus annectens]XP_043936499.1 interferon-inducible GTPase 5-like [Protopterus annectens]
MDVDEEFYMITDEEVEEISNSLESGNLADAATRILENMKQLENAKLDIAITGESGSGKSTFINVVRGLEDDEVDGAAKTGVVETTRVPAPYPHPNYPNVRLWDLPGIGTPNFSADKYLERVNFSTYDFFIIIASERFRANHAKLATEIQKMQKKFYFVRSKVDADLYAAQKRRNTSYNELNTLNEIKDNCIMCLQDGGLVSPPQVFLISSFELGKYDFHDLESTLERELPEHKRHAFLLCLPNLSIRILEKKIEVMRKTIWKYATISCGIATVPIPGLSVACDIAILVKALTKYRDSFGLDDDSLRNLSRRVNKPVKELMAAVKSPLSKEITSTVVKKMLTNAVGGGLMLVEYIVSTIPLIGTAAAGGISFATTYYLLRKFLDELAKDAHSVLITALGTEV